ncbi:MAG: protein kinase domain-containing protein, partial [Planctomycetota bacterium]
MSEVPWNIVRPVLEQVLELDGPERETRIEQLCGDDVELATEVRRLVALEDQEAGSDAAAKLAEVSFHQFLGLPKALAAGDVHGGFQIERELGAGGMGRVYLARQAHPSREVALKVMRPDLATAGYMARFRREESILGSLQHPGIAQIFEAGAWTDDHGQDWPFFAMEYVRGARTLTEHCALAQPKLEDKVQLFRDICDAVHEAHRRGVVHRDLKPGNLLVDEDGKAKVIDFGVARASGSDSEGFAELTHTGEMVGTVRFMSPEQVEGGSVEATSDVYSLGVVLYELLCGRSPYGEVAEEVTPLALAIVKTDPVRPSLIEPSVGGDLEWVLLRCLEKDPARRYPDAGALRDELTAFLAGRPVSAGPPSLTYRTRRFVARNRLAVTLTLLLVVGLSGAGVVSVGLYLDAREEEIQRDLEAKNAALARQSLLLSITSLQSRAAERLRVDKMLETASRDVGEVFKDDRDGELMARLALVQSMQCIGMIQGATAEAQRCLELIGDSADVTDARVAGLRFCLAQGAFNQGRPREALELAQATLEQATELGGEACPGAIRAGADLGNLLVIARRDVPRGQELLTNARRALLERQDPNDPLLLRVERHLAVSWTLTGRAEEGLELIRSVIERTSADRGTTDPQAIMLRLDEASTLAALGRLPDAAAAAKSSLAGIEAELPSDHPLRLFTLAATSSYIAGTGDHEQALRLLEPNMALLTRVWGAEHPETLKAESVLADSMEWVGRADESLRAHRALVDRVRELMGPDAPQLVPYLYRLGAALERADKLVEALPHFEAVVRLSSRTYGPANPNVLGLQLTLATHYVDLDRLDDAQRNLEALQQQRERGAASMLGDIWMLEGRVLLGLGRREDARAPLQKALAWFTERQGATSAAAAAPAAARA